MKILINTRDLSFQGGVVNYLKVLNLKENPNIDYFTISKPKVNSKVLYLIYRYVIFYLTIKKYDLIQINPSFGSTALLRDMIFAAIAKIRRKKLICFMHGWDEDYEKIVRKSIVLKFLYKNTIGKTDAFFVLGEIFKEKLMALGLFNKKSKFYVQTMIADPNFLEKDYIKKKIKSFSIDKKTWRFLFISRIVKSKGIDLAVNCFNLIQKKYSKLNFEFHIAGDGEYLTEIKKRVKKEKIKNIFFYGFIENEKKHKILEMCDITFFPTSYGEGLPNTIMEGMLYGHPIITRKVGGIPQWVKNGENGFITKSERVKDFLAYIENLIKNKRLCEKMSEQNHIVAIQNFTKEKVLLRHLSNYEDIYNNVV